MTLLQSDFTKVHQRERIEATNKDISSFGFVSSVNAE